MKNNDWFKLKKYPHIGLPLEQNSRQKWIESYIKDTEKIKKHSFLPFIHKVSKKRRYRKEYDEAGIKKTRIFDGRIIDRFKEIKPRELFYASHLDSLIYSYYTQLLTKPYEDSLIKMDLEEVVTAYRRIPKDRSRPDGSNKCNVDFANDVFKIIKSYPHESFSVITFDIKSFFDTINHELLRKMWTEILDVDELAPDHFNVFKNITRFSYVDIQDIFKEYQAEIICQRKNKQGGKLQKNKKNIKRIRFLKNHAAIAFCDHNDFLKDKKHLIKSHKMVKEEGGNLIKRDFGIPQGSPISSLLANIYLLHFDKVINDFVCRIDGYYRRYSDDMIVICKTDNAEEIEKLFYDKIEDYKLKIQPAKTQKFIFERSSGKLCCAQRHESYLNSNRNLIYLGFEFDGQKILLKSASLAGFYRKMKKSIRRGIYYSRIHKKEIFKRRLYKKFTFRGARKYKILKWNANEKRFLPTEQQNWGNFLSYAKKASNVMDENGIKKQIKNHWKVFHRELNRN